MRLRATAVLAFAVAAPVSSDVIPPGHKPVVHDILIAGTERFPEYTFFVAPTSMAGGVHRVRPGQPIRFYKLASPRLWAVKGPVPATPTLLDLDQPGNPRSSETFHQASTVPELDPTSRIRTTVTVKSIDKGVLRLERVDKRSRSPEQPSDPALALLALIGVLGLTSIARSRRQTGVRQ